MTLPLFIAEIRTMFRSLGGAGIVLTLFFLPTALGADLRLQLEKARSLQHEHHFAEALEILDTINAEHPEIAEAWLMKSTILTVTGRYKEARKASLPLFDLSSPLIATTAGTAATSCNGQLSESYQLLKNLLGKTLNSPADIQSWALSSLADMTSRLGLEKETELHLKEALQLTPESDYLLTTYGYFLLRADRANDVLNLFANHREKLPWLIAYKTVNGENPTYKKAVKSYTHRLHSHGHHHGREEALYYLYIRNNARRALHNATVNWQTQKEPEDLLILLEAAMAAENHEVTENALRWVRESRFEDVRLLRFRDHRKTNQ